MTEDKPQELDKERLQRLEGRIEEVADALYETQQVTREILNILKSADLKPKLNDNHNN